jgi:AcrR family transcriptional regulator
MMSRVIKDPEERREEIIVTAERLFLARGYEDTSISDIVKEINVSQGAFYYYFESKEDVLIAVMMRQIAQMERDFIDIAGRDDLDEAMKINMMANRMLCLSDAGKKIHGYIHQSKNATLRLKLMRARPFAEIAPVMANVIAAGCSKGRFHVSRPLETSYLLLALMASSIHIFYRNGCSASSNESLEKSNAFNINQPDEAFLENMREALQDLLARALDISDFNFVLKI